MKKILEKNKNIKIILSWKYWESENVNSKLSKAEILSYFNKEDHNKIIFLWLVPYEKMPNIYNHVDICVFPSIYDNYPWVVIESLLMWKAVICSKNTWIVEAIKEWIIYIDPTNISSIIKETQKLIDNSKQRELLWIKWYNQVKNLNNNIINKFIDYYHAIYLKIGKK
jgi:glycosyltransferase involved in cell wall biosynthesis